jgi:outer membrane protein OmpA-like peptidoglycan-associated protein
MEELVAPMRENMETDMLASIQMSVMLVLLGLSILPVPRAQAEELSHDEMVCVLTGECGSPFVDRRVRGLTTAVAPRPAMSFDRSINFGSGSAGLSTAAKAELDNIISVLKDPRVKDVDVIISGHTDGKGSSRSNQQLSERRALSVKSYLAQHGVDKKRLTATGYGSSKLLLPQEPANALNRRVEFRNAKGVAANETIKPLSEGGGL